MMGPMPTPDPRQRRAAAGIGRLRVRRFWGAAGLMLGLAGCAGLNGPMQKQVDVLGGAVTVAAPSGYCIGPGTVSESKDTAVVLIGRCIDAGFVAPAVISVSVGHPGSSGVMATGDAALAKFFSSSKGLAIVSRSGRSRDVKLLATDSDRGAFLMHLDDRLTGDYWRAILGLRGRLVTVTAVGTGKVPLAPASSRRVVEKTLIALQNVNPPEAPASEPAAAAAGLAGVTATAAPTPPATVTVTPKGGLSVSPVPPPRPGARSSVRPSGIETSPVPPPRPGESANLAASSAKFAPLGLVPPGTVPPPRPWG